ncbi:hypothetical protein JCM6882_007424 [Rhodosporidiobolus microsporus]
MSAVSTPFTYLITGASRSLGLAYVKRLLDQRPEAKIVAAARAPEKADALKQVADENEGRVFLLKLDLQDAEGCKNAAQELEKSGFLGDNGLDCLINNAGILGSVVDPTATSAADLLEPLATNLFGTANVTQAFLPLLNAGQGKQIFTISSTCGSIEDFGNNTLYTAYSVSKCALNMYMSKIASELGPKGFTVVTVCPGYTATDFNNYAGSLSIEQSVHPTVANIFLAATAKENGHFIRYNGERVPW